jgi:hypothetical protein
MAHFHFFTINFTVWSHILSTVGDALIVIIIIIIYLVSYQAGTGIGSTTDLSLQSIADTRLMLGISTGLDHPSIYHTSRV